ncbi:MAG: GTP cyclohydrolase I FolE2 [Verrucomicrobiae bacterium]|nr:GTP cyclohydrolase I FolE2 [Verrucomicrobiae bacterium]
MKDGTLSSSSEQANAQADPQAGEDTRGIFLEKVGISRVRYPVVVSGWETDTSRQREVEGLFDLSVSLAARSRGIHMSRLIEALHRWKEPLSPASLQTFLTEARKKQGAVSAKISCAFTWFINCPAPQTGHSAWLGIQSIWQATQKMDAGISGYTLRIPVTTLCPCSRDISDYGAHSQRGWISVQIEWPSSAEIIPPREVFDKLRNAGSAAIYPLLKRPDERFVTMQAYDQPAFVEDTARNAALLLQEDLRISGFRIEVRNEESIHTHDAIAIVTSDQYSNQLVWHE